MVATASPYTARVGRPTAARSADEGRSACPTASDAGDGAVGGGLGLEADREGGFERGEQPRARGKGRHRAHEHDRLLLSHVRNQRYPAAGLARARSRRAAQTFLLSTMPSHPTMTERLRQARRLLSSEGAAGVSARLRARAAAAIAPQGDTRLRVTREDLLAAAEVASAGCDAPGPAPVRPGEPLTIGWVSVPPAESSGGHATMFRMITALERAGHTCVLYLDDRHGWDIEQHRREHPRIAAVGARRGARRARRRRDARALVATAGRPPIPCSRRRA